MEESSALQASHLLCNFDEFRCFDGKFDVALYFFSGAEYDTIYQEAYSDPKEQFFHPTWWWLLNNTHHYYYCHHHHHQTTVNFKQSTLSEINNTPTNVIECRWTKWRKMWQPSSHVMRFDQESEGEFIERVWEIENCESTNNNNIDNEQHIVLLDTPYWDSISK